MTLKMLDGQCELCESCHLHRNAYCGECLRGVMEGMAGNTRTFTPAYLAELLLKITRDRTERTSTALYRYFDADGLLLYVGISARPDVRRTQHEGSSEWYRFAASWAVEWYDHREDAARQEIAAIGLEHPLFNQMGSDATAREPRALKYLLDKGATDLLRAAI